MEKVLRESDDGILIYVAPTKALVNQVAAEVYARFSKDVNGRKFHSFSFFGVRANSCSTGAFWSIHTRDYRVHDSQKCQIMVTVPEILTVMLLSPPLARTWTPRIKRSEAFLCYSPSDLLIPYPTQDHPGRDPYYWATRRWRGLGANHSPCTLPNHVSLV